MRTDALKTKSTTKTKQTLHNYPQTLPNSDTAQLPIETLPKTNTAQLPTETQVSANIATITLRNSAKLKHHTTACRNSAKNKHCTITDRNSPRNKHYPNTHRNSAKTLPKANTAQGRLAAGALSVCKHLNWTSISRRTKQAHTVLQAAFSSQNDQLFNSPPPPPPHPHFQQERRLPTWHYFSRCTPCTLTVASVGQCPLCRCLGPDCCGLGPPKRSPGHSKMQIIIMYIYRGSSTPWALT